GLGWFPLLAQHLAEVEMRGGIVLLEADGIAEAGGGLLPLPQLIQGTAEVVVGGSGPWADPDGHGVETDGVGVPLGEVITGAQLEVDPEVPPVSRLPSE